uniref:Uncharacterized protein n=1 Tax=viral metagenome TaxID=1070528 RepID=A0A6C0KM88_9ZZZZ
MNIIYTVILWLILNIIIGLTMDFALFTQTTPDFKDAGIFPKLLSSEFWASIEWMFVIPANRIGNTFISAAQLSLSSYVFDFLAQLWSNSYWLKLPTTIDDYAGMILIFFGMYSSKYIIFG